jgi:hypothetical protein
MPVGCAGFVIGIVILQVLNPDPDTPVWSIALMMAGVAAVYFAILHRTLHREMIPLAVVAALAGPTCIAPLGLLEKYSGACVALLPSHPGVHAAIAFAFLLAAGFGCWLGFRALGGISAMQARGWISDVSMAIFFGLSMVATLLGAGLNTWFMATLPLTLAIYIAVLGRKPLSGKGRSLLLLRVFAEKDAMHEMLDQVQSIWRRRGPICQIGGPDLAALNVSSYEFAMFLSGRLHDIFLPEAATPAQLQKRLRRHAGPEGRYPINEVFCFNSAWKATVEQLMRLSDAVLIDVRGLTPQRAGASYEIGMLTRCGFLDHAVAAGGAATDWALLDQLIAAAGGDPLLLARHDMDSEGTSELVARLLRIVDSSSSPAGI